MMGGVDEAGGSHPSEHLRWHEDLSVFGPLSVSGWLVACLKSELRGEKKELRRFRGHISACCKKSLCLTD